MFPISKKCKIKVYNYPYALHHNYFFDNIRLYICVLTLIVTVYASSTNCKLETVMRIRTHSLAA